MRLSGLQLRYVTTNNSQHTTATATATATATQEDKQTNILLYSLCIRSNETYGN
jgi:hypothetical protein